MVKQAKRRHYEVCQKLYEQVKKLTNYGDTREMTYNPRNQVIEEVKVTRKYWHAMMEDWGKEVINIRNSLLREPLICMSDARVLNARLDHLVRCSSPDIQELEW